MRTSTAQLRGVLSGGSFSATLSADVFYGSTRSLADVPIDDWSFQGDLDAEVPVSGTLRVKYQGDFAESYTPRKVTDALAPFGQTVIPYVTVRAGGFSERLQLGVYRLSDVPSARDEHMRRNGRHLVIGSVVELTVMDLFDPVRRAKFRRLEQPASSSVWSELARVTRLPVTRTVPDQNMPGVITYDRNRVTAAQVLAGYLGGRAVPLSDGTVGVIPDELGPIVAELRADNETGVLLDIEYAMSSKDVPNVVYGDFEDAAGKPIHVESEESNGPLAVTGPYGEHVAEFPDERKAGIDTPVAAQEAVDAYRRLLAKGSAPRVPLSTLFDPRLELGDAIRVVAPDRTLTGRIVNQRMSGSATTGPNAMELTVEVATDEATQ